MEETTAAIKQSCEDQKKGITTFIEVILNQELGEPFRRDAMKKPVKVAWYQQSRYEKATFFKLIKTLKFIPIIVQSLHGSD
jgi:sulfoacetaldehyde acetyltransferase